MDDPNHIYSCFDDPGPRILTHPFLACYPIQLRLPAYCRIVRPRDLGHPTCLGTDDDRFGRHRGFIQVDISDKSTHDIFYSLGAPLRQWKFDVSIGPRSGLEHVRQYQMQRSAGNEKVHVLQWDLKEAPSKLDGRIIVPRVYEGWTDGYSQSSGCYNDAIWLSKDSEMWLVRGRLLANSSCSEEPKPIHVFDAELVWGRLVSKGKVDLTQKRP